MYCYVTLYYIPYLFVFIDEEESSGGGGGANRSDQVSDQEKQLREEALDYELRFCGHCNTTTDIKEANFFGRHVPIQSNMTDHTII